LTISASFFDHVKYPAQEFINRDADFIGNGVLHPATDFALTYNNNMTVNIGAGTSWANGMRIGYDANPSLTLTFATADATNPRIDLIEIGTTGTGTQGAGAIKVVTGVPQANPLQPQPDLGFIALYAVRVNAGVTAISAANITDLRSGISIAGATNTPLASSVPGTQTLNTTGSAGTSSNAARADHVHPMANITPSGIGAEPAIATKNTAFNQNFETLASNIQMNGTASAGTSTNVARADHVHPSDTSKVNITDYTKIIGDADDTGTANTYVITLATAPTAYAEYQMFRFKAKNSNTGASTLNVNGLGTIALVKGVNTALVAGDILAGQIITVIHDGTNLQIVSANGQNLITQPMRWVI